MPSLHVYYKNTHLKQYHKYCPRGAASRTETTINNTYDFGVGRRLKNLPALRQIGFAANRRVLQVEQLTHDCHIGAEAFDKLQKPAEVDGQHVSALPFGQERVQALLTVLVLFCLQPQAFRNRQLRPLLAQWLGLSESQISPGRMSYEMRPGPIWDSESPSHCASNGRSWRLRKPSGWRQNKTSTVRSACTRSCPKGKAEACWPSTSAGFWSLSNASAPMWQS